MSARSSPGAGRLSPVSRARDNTGNKGSEADGNSSSGSPTTAGGGSGIGVATEGEGFIGRKLLKGYGDTVVNGFVKEYNPPAGGGEPESWTISYDAPYKDLDAGSRGCDDDGDGGGGGEETMKVNRSELDKLLNLQAVREREFPKGSGKKGRGRGARKTDSAPSSTNGAAASPKTKEQSKKSATVAAAAAAAAPSHSSPSKSGGEKRPAPSRSSSPGRALTPTKSKKKKPEKEKAKEKEGKRGGDSAKLTASKADVGIRVAREFTLGVFTGEVVEVKDGDTRGPLWRVLYEDGDGEDFNEAEMIKYMGVYKLLADRFEAAKGRVVNASDLAAAGLAEEDDAAITHGTPTSKGKGKEKQGGGRLSEQQKLVGVKVRKFFPRYEEEFDGKVEKYLPPESDDDFGDLWLIKYEDDDTEHMDAEELAKARALYKKRYGLVRKRVSYPTSALGAGQPATKSSKDGGRITLYGEMPPGSRGIFCTIDGYRRSKKRTP